MNWEAVFALIVAGFLIWMLYSNVKRNPESFSRKSLGKSFYTMGLLALVLIGLIFFCVALLRG